jgi:hypothetical protein
MKTCSLLLPLLCVLLLPPLQPDRASVTYPPKAGPGQGRHVVLLSGDEEYRSEEALPMLGKVLSQRHGFKCTVLFSVDPDGTINPKASTSLSDPAALDTADAIVMSLRFRAWPDDTMERFERLLRAGKPIVALRTSTHAFNGFPKGSRWESWNYNNQGGFGERVLGETWLTHWGRHKLEATRGVIEESRKAHPVLRGVTDIFGDTDVYEAYPPSDATILVRGLVLKGMTADSEPADYRKRRSTDKEEQAVNDPPMAVAWTRLHKNDNGTTNRILTTTMGSATDLESQALRRLVVNGVYWGLGLDVPARADVRYVDEYVPSFYGFEGFRKGLRASDFELGKKVPGQPLPKPVRGGAQTPVPAVAVEPQPLAANVSRLMEALEYLGAPLGARLRAELTRAGQSRDAAKLQALLDPQVLATVHINPEARVKVSRGPAEAVLQQAGYTPVLVKVINESRGTQRLRIGSPQSGPVYAGMSKLSGERMQQAHLREHENIERRTDRFLDVEMYTAPPMTANLSGFDVEYAIALMYSSESGRREATLTFDAGQGTEDLGFRAEVPVLFTVKPAVAVKLSVLDHDGKPTTARLQFVDRQGHVFPPQPKRLAPDLFFQKHIYRSHGEHVLLPPGVLTMFYGRGPEYRWMKQSVIVPAPGASSNGDPTPAAQPQITVRLDRWIDPAAHGFFSGDHHIHAAGCAHYTSPTEGVNPADMFRQLKGEGLNVGSVLTWGPGFDHQKQFFSPGADARSEPRTVMKYDIEVSGFGSEALGHVVLLNLKEQIYPGANGSKGWPTWTLPVLRWAKEQGGVGGYAHSGSGLQIDAAAATRRLIDQLDSSGDGRLDAAEAARGLLPEPFAETDANADGLLAESELAASHDRVDDTLPNLAIPELNSVGAQEIFVTAAHGVADFISAMDTDRISEWNAWYHLMNAGLPVKASGETDFPCMSGTRVGQGRSYVQLGKTARVEYTQWCKAVARGQSYVSDGYAHAFGFSVNGRSSGEELEIARPARVTIKATVAFSPETPFEPAHGGAIPVGGRRHVGDTVIMREKEAADPVYERGQRLVELIVNGRAVASREVPADGRQHPLEFTVAIDRSSWVALRQFPQLHTNPVDVIVAGKPIRASRESALWALACIDQLWRVRARRIAPAERADAERAYEQAREIYRRIAAESPSWR